MIEFLVAEKESETSKHTHLCNVYGSVVVNRNTAGQWLKSSNASGIGKTELHDLPQAILPQLLVLKYLSMLRPLFARINASQRNNWCSVLQSAKEESHHLRPYIRRGFMRWFPQSLTVEHKIERRAEGETFLSHIGKADETWAQHFELKKKGNPWNSTILNLSRIKNSKSPSVSSHDQCLLGLCWSNSSGSNAGRGHNSTLKSKSGC